jgi:hypothetical protein
VGLFFGLPGQPEYRLALGKELAPPRIRFKNFVYNHKRPVTQKNAHEGKPDEDTFEVVCNNLEPRIKRFRSAEYAVSLGLDPTAFETN